LGDLTSQAIVKSPIETVFSFVASPWNAPRYISSIPRLIAGPNGPPAVGQTWQAEVSFLGQRNLIELRLQDLRSPGLVRFSIEGEPQATLELHLAQAGDPDYTRVALTLDVPSVPSILLSALMSPLLAGDMERLKSILEANG
jgi:hypothetical protein